MTTPQHDDAGAPGTDTGTDTPTPTPTPAPTPDQTTTPTSTNMTEDATTGVEKRLRFERRQAREVAARLQRREVERVAGEVLAQPGDFWTLAGDDVTPWLTDDGDIDADAVRARAQGLRDERPGLARVLQRHDPDQGRHDDRQNSHLSIGEALRSTRRQP